MKSNKKNSKTTIILILVLFVLGLIAIFAHSYFQENNASENKIVNTKSVNNDINNSVVKKELINLTEDKSSQKLYLGDIHLQIGLSNLDYLEILFNGKDVFNSKNSNESGNFQIQVFNTALIGENNFEIKYKDNKDDQPLIFYIIKDGKENIKTWKPDNDSGEDSFKVEIK